MLSNFQVTVSWWFPDRFTVFLAPRVKTRAFVEQSAASAAQVATALYDELLKVPRAPVALVHAAAFHVTSLADQVVAPPGAVNVAAFAWSETLNCFVAVASTMPDTLTDAAVAAVAEPTSATLKVTPEGTVTRACSLTFAVNVVDCEVSVRLTGVCA